MIETCLLVPEPRALRTERSVVIEGAVRTALSPAREIKERPGLEVYDRENFQRLGLSVESFEERARKTADKLLKSFQPEVIKNAKGEVVYAVYRNERPVMACLLVAPSLPQVFESLFGEEIWVAAPDRHSLYVFPAKAEAMQEYIDDLAERYRTEAFAASVEVFSIKAGEAPKVVGAFGS